MKAFVILQYSYCRLEWIYFTTKTLKIHASKINALRLFFDDNTYLSFNELLVKDKSVSIHQINLQYLATDIFQAKNGCLFD